MKAIIDIFVTKDCNSTIIGELTYSIDSISTEMIEVIKNTKEIVLGIRGNGASIVMQNVAIYAFPERDLVYIYGARAMDQEEYVTFWLLEHGAEFEPSIVQNLNPKYNTTDKKNWVKLPNNEFAHIYNKALRTTDFKTMYFSRAKNIKFPMNKDITLTQEG